MPMPNACCAASNTGPRSAEKPQSDISPPRAWSLSPAHTGSVDGESVGRRKRLPHIRRRGGIDAFVCQHSVRLRHVVTFPGLHDQVLLLHGQMNVPVSLGLAGLVGRIADAVLAAQFFFNLAEYFVDRQVVRHLDKPTARLSRNLLQHLLAVAVIPAAIGIAAATAWITASSARVAATTGIAASRIAHPSAVPSHAGAVTIVVVTVSAGEKNRVHQRVSSLRGGNRFE